jgi:hypothetical protein
VLRAASALWLVSGVLLLVAAGSFAASAALPGSDRAGLTGLAAVLGALAVVQLVLVVGLRRGKRSARELLTTGGIIAGLPVLVRGTPGLSVIAVLVLLAVGAHVAAAGPHLLPAGPIPSLQRRRDCPVPDRAVPSLLNWSC